jgi:hypothetical protein
VLVIWPNVFGALMSRAGGPKLGVFVRFERLGPELDVAPAAGVELLASTASTFW